MNSRKRSLHAIAKQLKKCKIFTLSFANISLLTTAPWFNQRFVFGDMKDDHTLATKPSPGKSYPQTSITRSIYNLRYKVSLNPEELHLLIAS